MDRKMSEQKLNIEFVKEVEHYPCIYDYRRLDYARKDVIDKAWAKIGTKFNLSGPQCRERWKNLRTVLSRNLRPNEGNGRSRASKQQRKPYYLFEAMKFAVPFIKSHNTVPSYFRPRDLSHSASDQDGKSEGDNEEDAKEAICHVKVENLNYGQSCTPSPEYTSPPPSPQVNLLEAPSPTTSSPPPQRVSKRNRRKRRKSNDSVETEIDEIVPKHFKPKKSKVVNKLKMDLTKISKKRFLLSLLSDVYSMDNIQMRSFRMKVLQLINEITQTPSNTDLVCQCACNAATSSRGPEQSSRSQGSTLSSQQLNESQNYRQDSEKSFQTLNSIDTPLALVEVKIEKDE